jgi:polyferredoxin
MGPLHLRSLNDYAKRRALEVQEFAARLLKSGVSKPLVAVLVFAFMLTFGMGEVFATAPANSFSMTNILDDPTEIITLVATTLGGVFLAALGLNLGFLAVKRVYRWATGSAR